MPENVLFFFPFASKVYLSGQNDQQTKIKSLARQIVIFAGHCSLTGFTLSPDTYNI